MLNITISEDHNNGPAMMAFHRIAENFEQLTCHNHPDHVVDIDVIPSNNERGYDFEVGDVCCDEFRLRLLMGPLRGANFEFNCNQVENLELLCDIAFKLNESMTTRGFSLLDDNLFVFSVHVTAQNIVPVFEAEQSRDFDQHIAQAIEYELGGYLHQKYLRRR